MKKSIVADCIDDILAVMSKTDAAKALGIRKQHLYTWTSGRSKPNMQNVEKILELHRQVMKGRRDGQKRMAQGS